MGPQKQEPPALRKQGAPGKEVAAKLMGVACDFTLSMRYEAALMSRIFLNISLPSSMNLKLGKFCVLNP
jgi:hypothetical protein